MKQGVKKSWILLAACLALIFVCMGTANRIQTGGGSITVTQGRIDDISYKLYTPSTATEANKAPGVLLLHGYQNDHETCAAYAIELARRGVVVMAIDEFGHGATESGMIQRGYTNHTVKVNYGEDSIEAGTYKTIGGPLRYRLLLNFSNLSFFEEHYSKGTDGSKVSDSSMGGVAAYAVLATMDNVDPTRLAVSGHSMGTWASWSVSAVYAGVTDEQGRDITPKATVLQCGELFTDDIYDLSPIFGNKIYFNNVLLLQAKWDEFNYFRDYRNTVSDELLSSPLRLSFLGTEGQAAWNTTYGSFADGTARRMELLYTNHRLTTHHAGGLATALEWFDEAIDLPTEIPYTDQVAMTKEWLVLAAAFLAILSMMPLCNILLETPLFKEVAQPLPPKAGIKKKGAWLRGALVTILIAGLTYPFMTQLGQGLLPLPETTLFRMTIGNGFVGWYSLLIIIMILFTVFGRRKARKAGTPLTWQDAGLGSADKPEKFSWKLLGKGALLALCMVGFMYVLVVVCEKLFQLDFRFIWPFFKSFSLVRFGQFCVYILFFAAFYILNNSKIFAGLRSEGTYEKGFKGFMKCWWRYALVMVGGTLLIILIEYIPFFAGLGPGADLLFGSTFGGPFMSLLIVFAPQVLIFSLIGTHLYRRTGNVFTGAMTIAFLACWIVTGGSAML
ncbi:MAG: alpha/beta hydrolase [Lachnospiraceae bacterium]|nr:alpha/beta hydrolase [Lachnospiraceae bacterium]